jgi:hypothetical protein
LHPIIQASPFVIIESNSILRFIQPDLTIMTLRFDVAEFKNSAREMLMKADVVVAIGYHSLGTPWQGIPAESLTRMPLFAATDIQTVPPGLVEWMQKRLHL